MLDNKYSDTNTEQHVHKVLDSIKDNQSLKNMSIDELNHLASEIRNKIILVLSKTGGHLASNLGIVELTIALHYVFSSPQDKFIFDVGHQTYTHKLLTDRNNEQFNNIRLDDGLSGFSSPDESDHDVFFSGHAGTALSQALGIYFNKKVQKSNSHIIPIIGDASLTCGLSLEALNNFSTSLERFIVILNDNKMSISNNVGKMSQMLSRLLHNPTANKISTKLKKIITKIPFGKSQIIQRGQKLSKSLIRLFSSAPFFEQFGISYIGPVDGHDIKKLIQLFSKIKDQSTPIIVHVITKKGFGVESAEDNPIKFHGVSPLKIPVSCDLIPTATSEKTFPKIAGEFITELGSIYKDLMVVTPAMSVGSCLEDFKAKHTDRMFDVGIAEGHAVTFSGALAKYNNPVICSIYSTFLQRALDNVFHDVCLQNVPVIFAIDRAGLSFNDGMSHHGIYDMGFLRAMPNIIICQPRNGQLLKDLLFSAISWQKTVAIRYPNASTTDAHMPAIPRLIGVSEILAFGENILIIALGHMCSVALDIRIRLLSFGISVTVLDPIFIKPLDKNTISNLLITHSKLVVIEEHSIKSGLSSEISEFLVSFGFDQIEVLLCAIPDKYITHGTSAHVLQNIGLTASNIMKQIIVKFGMTKLLEKNRASN